MRRRHADEHDPEREPGLPYSNWVPDRSSHGGARDDGLRVSAANPRLSCLRRDFVQRLRGVLRFLSLRKGCSDRGSAEPLGPDRVLRRLRPSGPQLLEMNEATQSTNGDSTRGRILTICTPGPRSPRSRVASLRAAVELASRLRRSRFPRSGHFEPGPELCSQRGSS